MSEHKEISAFMDEFAEFDAAVANRYTSTYIGVSGRIALFAIYLSQQE